MLHNEWMTLGELIGMLKYYDPDTVIYAGIEGLEFDHSQEPFKITNAPLRFTATPLIID